MIVKLKGRLDEVRETSLVIENGGVFYEVLMPGALMERVAEKVEQDGKIELITYHYWQATPSQAVPVLIGFFNEVEKDFFLQFIKVSGIGPRAAVKALNRPISEIARAVNEDDSAFLKGLPGIGARKAKEIIAKLQGRVGRYGLIRDGGVRLSLTPSARQGGWREEALLVLDQLQYSRREAEGMVAQALERRPEIQSAEDLLNEIYKQRIQP